jgi:serine beta-lactamase-like protein LACTB, mitochondrial
MRTHVFEPLGMTETVPDLSFSDEIPDRVTFYYPRFAANTRYGPQLLGEGDYSCLAGASGFLSTPSDLVRFGIAMSRDKLLQRATIEVLQSSLHLRSGEDTGYGLGWKLETLPLAGQPARMAGHNTRRDFLGATASLMTFPERGIVVAVTSNTAFANTRSIALTVAERFAEGARRPKG